MKKFFLGLIVVITGSAVVISCQKQTLDAGDDISKVFNAKAAKEWYYDTFKKSPEWQTSTEKEKKLPDWGKPLITKVGNNEVVEFPLIESTSSYSISSTGNNGILP